MSHYHTFELTAKPLNLAGTPSSLQLFTPLAQQPWAIWLDSSDSDHLDSRFDILVWQPEYTLTTKGLFTTITHVVNNTKQLSDADPLALVKQIQAQVFASISLTNLLKTAAHLPFKGGAVGYFSYDLGHRFEVLPTIATKDIKQADMAVGIYTQALVYDKKTAEFWLICPEHKRAMIHSYLAHLLENTATPLPFCLTSAWQSNMSQQDYQHKFASVAHYLLNGDCYQINLAQRFTATYQGDEFCAYQALRASNQAPFSAFMRLDNAAILSLSPERFLQLNGQQVQSKPIKGTRARQVNESADQVAIEQLLASDKDRAENLMIVDLLRNDLSKVCEPGSVVVPKLFAIESFPAVHHLVSTVEGILSPLYDATDLLRGAFPGGSITGAPKIRAMEIIEELEPHQRSIYCGSMGYISACGNMDTSITIRTLICENEQIHCWAGGGLVADSNVDSEYQETFDKVNKILPVLTAL